MSTATMPQRARAATPKATQPATRPRSRPPVRAVRTPAVPPARAPFVIAVLVLLSFGLGALLLLNTLLAQGSFTLHTLNAQLTELTDREQALQQRASELAAPQRLARHANALGMVPSQNPAFLREEDGKVLGEPVPAVARVTPAEVVGSDTQDTSSTETNSSSSSGSASTRDDKQNDKPSDQQEQQDNKQDQQGKHDQEKADDGTTNNSEDGGADR